MIFHVCQVNGDSLGEFSEDEFNRKVLVGELKEDFYWHEGMSDWKPVAEYKILAKTQRISFAPPPRTTQKIDMNIAPAKETTRRPTFVSRLRDRLKGR